MSIQQSIQQLGPLRCRIIDQLPEGEQPRQALVLCHGFGAPGDDLASLGPWLLQQSKKLADGCRLYFPEAPIDLGPMGMPGGRAWWPINMAALAQMHETRDFSLLTQVEPPGMAEATELYLQTVQAIREDSGLTDDQIVLGGFSQGAMINTNLVLQQKIEPQLLVLFSGCLLASERWSQLAEAHSGCDVLQSHGTQDTVLPFNAAEALRDLLTQHGFKVTFKEFAGVHTIPQPVLNQLIQRMTESLS